MRFFALVVVTTFLSLAGSAAAEPTTVDVAGQSLSVWAAEHSENAFEYDDGVSRLTYDQDRYASGVTINGDGLTVDILLLTRESSYNGPVGSVEREEYFVRVAPQATAGGFTSDSSATVNYIAVVYDFGPLEHGEGNHVIVGLTSNSYGNGMQAYRTSSTSVGSGSFESAYMNNNPVVGIIHFAAVNSYSQGGGYVSNVAYGVHGGGGQTGYGGDWNGADGWYQLSAVRCFSNQCSWNAVAGNTCALGLKPPFFFACLVPRV